MLSVTIPGNLLSGDNIDYTVYPSPSTRLHDSLHKHLYTQSSKNYSILTFATLNHSFQGRGGRAETRRMFWTPRSSPAPACVAGSTKTSEALGGPALGACDSAQLLPSKPALAVPPASHHVLDWHLFYPSWFCHWNPGVNVWNHKGVAAHGLAALRWACKAAVAAFTWACPSSRRHLGTRCAHVVKLVHWLRTSAYM